MGNDDTKRCGVQDPSGLRYLPCLEWVRNCVDIMRTHDRLLLHLNRLQYKQKILTN